MNDHIAKLFARIASSDETKRNDAVVELGMILERNVVKDTSWLGEDVILPTKAVKLNIKEQQDVVDNIAKLLSNKLKNYGSLVWALGKAHVKMGLPPLLNYVQKRGEAFDDQILRQVVIVLIHYLAGPEYEKSDWRRGEISRHPELLPLIDRWHKSTADASLRDYTKRLNHLVAKLSKV